MKLSPASGILLATLVLGVIAGVMAELATYVQTADLGWMGNYAHYLTAFLVSVPVIAAVTWIYNVFMYIRQHQLAAFRGIAEQYNPTKLMETLAYFLGTIAPMFVLLPSGQAQDIGAFIVVLFRIVYQELQKVFANQQPTPPLANQTSTPSAPGPAITRP